MSDDEGYKSGIIASQSTKSNKGREAEGKRERDKRERERMEGKKSFVDELFPRRDVIQQGKSDILSSIFPPCSAGTGKDSHSNTSGSWRKQGDGNFRTNPGKSQSSSGKKYSNPVYLCELPESCLMSSSIYYGARDDFIPDSSSSHNSSMHYSYKEDKEDDSANTDVATRGDWWQGSFYY